MLLSQIIIIYYSAAWFKQQANLLDFSTFQASQVEKLSGDNTAENKKIVLDRLEKGLVNILIFTEYNNWYTIYW